MTDINDLKEEIKLLKEEIDTLKKQLKENSEGDERRHKEIQALQEKQHQENLTQNKVQSWGMVGTALTAGVGLITYLFKLFKAKDSDKMDKVLELLEKQK